MVILQFILFLIICGVLIKKKYIQMKKIITTKKAPAPIGPYNQAVLSGNTLYTSGQIAINPKTGKLVLDSIKEETKQVMENLKEVLTAAEMTFENVIKTSIFISHRLSSTQFCNRILYIENGSIQEEGSHLELMSKKGK